MKGKRDKFLIRAKRTRVKLKNVSSNLRLSVFRSNKHILAQIIDDNKRITLACASDRDIKNTESKLSPAEISFEVGKLIAKRAKDKKIDCVSFDRSGFAYHGRIKAIAEGARKEGLKL